MDIQVDSVESSITCESPGNVSPGITELKRKSENVNDTVPLRKRRKKAPSHHSTLRTAVCLLNELNPGIVYIFGPQRGPTHLPTFTVSVELDGKTFEGQGGSKKAAKQDAAMKALRSILPNTYAYEAHRVLKDKVEEVDFTTDVVFSGPSVVSKSHTASSLLQDSSGSVSCTSQHPKAFRSFLPNPYAYEAHRVLKDKVEEVDFTTDVFSGPLFVSQFHTASSPLHECSL